MFALNLQPMRQFIIVFLTLMSVLAYSQNDRNVLKEIDSISQKRWDSVALDLDSLAYPKLFNYDVLSN